MVGGGEGKTQLYVRVSKKGRREERRWWEERMGVMRSAAELVVPASLKYPGNRILNFFGVDFTLLTSPNV